MRRTIGQVLFRGFGRCHYDVVLAGDGSAVVEIVDPPNNTGRSVTNAIEEVARTVHHTSLRGVPARLVRWFATDQRGDRCEVRFSEPEGMRGPRWSPAPLPAKNGI